MRGIWRAMLSISVVVLLMSVISAVPLTAATLKVSSFPSGAQVIVDGADTGKVTPMNISLLEGDHVVIVQIPGPGWNPDTRTVTIVTGNNDLSVTLLPTLSSNLAGLSCPNGQFVTGFNGAGLPVCGTPSGSGGGGGGTSNDADGDGIPDALDPCPSSPNLFYNGGSYCPASMYDLTRGTLLAGATVFLTNLHVDSAAGSSIVVSVLPGDPAYQGAEGSSLVVDLRLLAVPAVGSRVNLIGVVLAGEQFSVASVVVTVGP